MKKPNYKDKQPKPEEQDVNQLPTSLINEINTVRREPEKYIAILENDKTYFKDNILYRPNEDPLRTQEGPAAHDEAIEFLKTIPSFTLSELKLDNRLSLACNDHVLDIGKTGAISHEGSNKETINQRVEVHAEWDYILCQNIDFGGKTVNEIIISFITGDGDPSRTHRKNLFRENIYFIGAAIGPHKETEICTVVAYAGNVRDLGSLAPEIKEFIPNHIRKLQEEKEKPKERQIKTKFQIEDPDAPSNAVSYQTFKKMKLVDGRAKHCTQRVYTLTDGTQHIVEIFDDLKVRCSTSSSQNQNKQEEKQQENTN
jgi:uncharacterized protein YkwD